MAIYSTSKIAMTTEQDDFYPEIVPTVECGMEIMYEAYNELYKLEAGVYVADLMIEEKVSEGADSAILVEGVVKDIINRAINVFKTLIGKVTAWAKEVKEKLFVRFGEIGKFVTQYEQTIKNNAAVNPVKYNGYEYHANPFDVFDDLHDRIKMVTDTAYRVDTVDGLKAKRKELNDIGEEVNATNTLYAKFRSADTKKDITPNIDFMIDFVKSYKKRLSEFEKMVKETINTIRDIIRDLEGEKNTENAEVITTKIGIFKSASAMLQNNMNKWLAVAKSMYSTFGGVLRNQAAKKPKTEKKATEESSTSILEAAMSMI